MKKKALIRSMLVAFFCCIMVLGFQTKVKAETGGYYIKVNKGTNVVTVYTKDDKPYTAFVCSAGYATPLGTFYTSNKYSWWVLDGPSYGQYCTRITGSILFHSVWYFQQDKTTQSYVQYNRLGSLASHGCIRITTAAAKWIYDNCPLQTKVIIFNGTSNDDPLGKPSAIKVSTSVRMGWDPTDPDPNNTYSTKNTQPKINVNASTLKLQYKAPFKPAEIKAYDSAGNLLPSSWLRTSGSVNTNQMGSYKVTYSLTDSFGRDASTTVTYLVGDASKATISGVRKEITKEYNSTFKLRSGITAKNSLGTVLTDKIVTKVRKPGSDEYKGMSASELKLRHTGTYRIMYYLKNPTNKMVTEKYTKIIVKDTKKPVITSKNNFATIKLPAETSSITYKKLLSGVTAKLASGKKMTSKISIKVTDPDGTVKTVSKNGSYKLSGSGTYTVTYYCSNPVKNLKTGKYLIASKKRKLVVEKAKPEENPSNPSEPSKEDPGTDNPADNPSGSDHTDTDNPVDNPPGSDHTDTDNPADNPSGSDHTDTDNPPDSGPDTDNPTDSSPDTDNPPDSSPDTDHTPSDNSSSSGTFGTENPAKPQPSVLSVVYTISAPEHITAEAGLTLDVLAGVEVNAAESLSDGTQRTSHKTDGIQYTIIYEYSVSEQGIYVAPAKGTNLLTLNPGIYRITYHYMDEKRNKAEYTRKITVIPASAQN